MRLFRIYAVLVRFMLALAFVSFMSVSLAAGATISGRVVDDGGKPLQNICVNALSLDCNRWVSGGVTDENGNYQIDVRDGTYMVSTDVRCGDVSKRTFLIDATWSSEGPVNECGKGEPVSVTGETPLEGINLVLENGGLIQGRAMDSHGEPIEGICVNALDVNDMSWLGGGVTDANGTYCITVESGRYFISTDVQCGGNHDGGYLIDRCWNPEGGTATCGDAGQVDVIKLQEMQLSPVVLPYGGNISGTVYHTDGTTPVTGMNLGVTIFSGGCDDLSWAGWAPVDPADGSFHSPGLPPGTYYLQTYNESGLIVDEWWAEPESTEVCEEAQAVTVVQGATASGKDFQLYVLADSDSDGLEDGIEYAICTDPHDADSDDDGIIDGAEDQNRNGVVDPGETDPCSADSDGDGLQDGTELGYAAGDASSDTDMEVFVPDEDPSTTTSPVDADSDRDGLTDGEEDLNHNGRRDEGTCETDAAVSDSGLYDGFTGREIDVSKWKDLEKVRGIKDGRLILGVRGEPEVYGLRNELPFSDPNAIYSIETVIIYLGSQTRSPGNVIPGVVAGGFFYSSSEGDVYAHIGIGEGAEGIRAAATVVDGGEVIYKHYFSMEVSTLHPYIMSIAYNQEANQFIFGLKDVISGGEEYLSSDAPALVGPPSKSFKGLTAGIYGSPGEGTGSVYAAFDNVRINSSEEYYDQFESGLIDPAKWSKQDRVRYVKDGKLVLSRHIKDGTKYTKEKMWEENNRGATYFGADVEITSTFATGGAQTMSYIAGTFYNDTFRSEYNGVEGNVGAAIALIYEEGAGYRIGYKSYRCNNADCSDMTQHKYGFMTPLVPEQTYHLSIDFTGDTLVFRCNNEVRVLPVSTPAYPPSYRGWNVGIKADAPDGNEAYARATFDNIRISRPEPCPYMWDLDKDRDVDGVDVVIALRDPYGINPVTVNELARAFGSE